MSDTTDLYQRALNMWGMSAQMDMIIEECAELQVAVSHWKRGRTNALSMDELCNEAADVTVMIEQLALMVPDGANRIAELRAMKLKRLLGRVQTAEQARASDAERELKG